MQRLSKEMQLLYKNAGPLTDVSHLRGQAVFTMGAGGSGKSFVAENKWLNYLPDPSGNPQKYTNSEAFKQRVEQEITQQQRSLSNLDFESVVEEIRNNYSIEIVPGNGTASIPFVLYSYDQLGGKREIPRANWKQELPPEVFAEVEGLTEVVFGSPVHEVPSYWRQINPDLYKEELAGYLATQPGYVHEMSSDMSKAYFEAALKTGDPLIIDGVGSNLDKMIKQIKDAKDAGYRVTLVWIYVPLTVNMIRNASRERKVDPDIIRGQFFTLRKNFEALSSLVDKAQYINNKFDPLDKKTWEQNCANINAFIKKQTGFDGLYEYMLSTPAKAEVQGPYAFVKFCGSNPILDKEKKIKELKNKRKELLRGRTASRVASASRVAQIYSISKEIDRLSRY